MPFLFFNQKALTDISYRVRRFYAMTASYTPESNTLIETLVTTLINQFDNFSFGSNDTYFLESVPFVGNTSAIESVIGPSN